MEIITGRSISKNVIKKLLKPVPKYILKQVRKIEVSVVPDKQFKKENGRWGGCFGHTDEKNKIVYIYLYAIAEYTNQNFRQHNNNWYHYAIETLANTLYWQIGIIDNPYADKEFTRESLIKFETAMTTKAKRLGVLEPPNPKKIIFFKIWRDKLLDRIMSDLKSSRKFQTSYLPYIDHLRKAKIGFKCRFKYKYNMSQLFGEVFEGFKSVYRIEISELFKDVHLNSITKDEMERMEASKNYRVNRSKFQRRICKIVRPKFYISKTGRKYPFFDDKQLDKVKRKLKWKPEIKSYYIG